jgi:hypothetical protein
MHDHHGQSKSKTSKFPQLQFQNTNADNYNYNLIKLQKYSYYIDLNFIISFETNRISNIELIEI